MAYNTPASEPSNMDELMNKGWNAMSSILDQEMPQKRKRRLLLPWFTAVGMLVGAAGIYLWQNSTQPVDLPKIETRQAPATFNKNEKIATLRASTQLGKSHAATVDFVHPQRLIKSANDISSRHASAIIKSPGIGDISDNNRGTWSGTKSVIPERKPQQVSLQSNIEAPVAEFTSAPEGPSRIVSTEFDLLSLPVPSELSTEASKIVPSQKYLAQRFTRHNFLLETGFTQAVLSNKSGLQVGLSYGYAIQKDIRLSIGLTYCYQFTPIQSLSDYNYDEAEPILNKSNAGALLRSNFNTRYHQVRIPASVLYQFSSRWGATAGISMIYDRPIINVQENSAKLSTGSPAFVDYNDINYPMVNSFSLAVDLGLQYRLSKHFAIRSAMLYNALPLINKELYLSQKSRHLEANLCLQYKF